MDAEKTIRAESTLPMLIVLAEDDEGHAVLFKRNLDRAGLQNTLIHLKDGQQTLDFLEGKGKFEGREPLRSFVLVLDINMPGVSGIEVLRAVKSNEKLRSIPVIVLTTTDDPGEVERCYELGCNLYITKPVSGEEFVEAIHRLGLFLQVVQVPLRIAGASM